MARRNDKYSGRRLLKSELYVKGNYTNIPNAFILNPDIKDAELRLLQYIMTNIDGIVITTKNCIRYLGKTKPSIDKSFGRLIALGVLKITDDIIEVIIPKEMNKYKIGYLHGKENLTTEAKKTLLSGKENLTTEVKNSYKKPLDEIDNDNDTSPIILNNTRVLPVPAKSGSTEQSHSNDNTNSNTGIELDLECDELQSQASPSVLAPSQHTPKKEDEKVGEESSLPIDDDSFKIIPNKGEAPPIEEELPIPQVDLHTPVQNSLQILLEHSTGLKRVFQDESITIGDFSSFSDSYIANVFLSIKLGNKDSYWADSLKQHNYNFKHYGVYVLAGRSALEVDFETELKSQLISQSKMSGQDLHKFIYGY